MEAAREALRKEGRGDPWDVLWLGWVGALDPGTSCGQVGALDPRDLLWRGAGRTLDPGPPVAGWGLSLQKAFGVLSGALSF